MGHYTLVEFSGRIKPEYVDSIPYFDQQTLEHVNGWYGGKFHDYSKVSRADFIPFGTTKNFMNDVTQNVWTVRCALKNYDKTVENFVEMVASKVFEQVTYFFVTPDSYNSENGPRYQYFFDGEGGYTMKTYYDDQIVSNFGFETVHKRGDEMDALDARKYEMFSKYDDFY